MESRQGQIMKRVSPGTVGWIGAAAAGLCFVLPVRPQGLILVPGLISIALGIISLLLVRRRKEETALPGTVALVLSFGTFVVPVLVELSAGGKGPALLLLPFLACALLVGIHTYFGIHVLARGIIFVDLSLAQVASLGAVFAFAVGAALGTKEAYLSSLAFALSGAVIFAVSRPRNGRIPQEAIIGIVYAVASAAAMLLVDRNPEGMELIENALTGRMLWVTPGSVVTTSRIYGAVAVLHILYAGRFSLISRSHEEARRRGLNVTLWDVVFYATFAVVITKSVEVSGVLLVFSFLVIPAVISSLFFENPKSRLVLGWILGTAASVAGLVISYTLDFSAGPAIVTVLTLFLLAAGLGSHVVRSSRPALALLRILGGGGVLVLTLYGFYRVSPVGTGSAGTSGRGHVHDLQAEVELHRTDELDETGHPKGSHAEHLLDHYFEDTGAQEEALSDLKNHTEDLMGLLRDESAEVRERAASVLPLVAPSALVERELERAFQDETDEWVRFEMASSLFELDRKRGGRALIELMANEDVPVFLRSRSAALLAGELGTDHGYRPEAGPGENRQALERLADDLAVDRP